MLSIATNKNKTNERYHTTTYSFSVVTIRKGRRKDNTTTSFNNYKNKKDINNIDTETRQYCYRHTFCNTCTKKKYNNNNNHKQNNNKKHTHTW